MNEEELRRQELIEEIKRKQLISQIQAKQSQAEPEAPPEAPAYDDDNLLRDRAGMVAQGATLGFGDEITSGLSAAGREVGSWFGLADEGTVADRYNERQERVGAERDAYREANPYEAVGFEVGGGLLTGGLGAARATGAVAARSIGKQVMQKVALKRALKDSAQEAAVKAPSWKRTAGILGAESAIAGAGASEGGLENRLKGAATGAAFGLPMGGALAGTGKLAQTLSKSRAGQAMGKGKDFIPLHLLNDGMLGEFYRNFLGRTYGGGQILRDQGARIGNRIKDVVVRGKEDLAGARDTEAAASAAAKGRGMAAEARYIDDNMGALTREADDIAAKIDDAAETLTQRKDAIDTDTASAKGRIDDTIEPEAAQRVEADTDSFRKTAARESLPEGAELDGEDLRELVAGMGPVEAREAINRWWRKDGFREAKSQDYSWAGGDSVQDSLRKMLVERPDLMLEVGDVFESVPGMAAKMQKAAMRTGKETGTELAPADMARILGEPTHIGGKAMMDLRNVFAKAANRSKSPGANRVKNEFDAIIKRRLKEVGGDEAVDRYTDQISRYGTSRTFDGSVDASWADRGNFTPKQWLAKQKVKTADRPLTEEAWQAREAASKGLSRAKKAAREQKKLVDRQAKKAKRKAGKQSKAEKSKLKKARAKLAERQAAVKAEAAKLRRVTEGGDKMRRRGRVASKKAKLDRATAQARKFVEMSPPERTSGLSSVLTTEELSAVPRTPGFGNIGTVIDLLGGSLVAKQLVRPGMQRTLMGETTAQKYLAELLRKGAPLTTAGTHAGARAAGLTAGYNSGDR